MSTERKSNTPELDKLHAVHKDSQAIGEFVEWLRGQGFSICKWREAGTNGEPRRRWKAHVPAHYRDGDPGPIDAIVGRATDNPDFEDWDAGFVQDHRSIEAWLAEYFRVDLMKVEEERCAILQQLREQQ